MMDFIKEEAEVSKKLIKQKNHKTLNEKMADIIIRKLYQEARDGGSSREMNELTDV
jgi:hypothetical protein